MRAAALALAALVLATALPLAAAEAQCAPVRADRTEALPGLAGLPAGWEPFLALDEQRLPPIPSVAARMGDRACDLTADLRGFAAVAGLAQADALARLAIATAYPDQLGVPEVRSLAIQGSTAHARTWSAWDGIEADWTVSLRTLEADFVVTAVGVGEHVAEMEGWHPWVGFSSGTLEQLQSGTLATKVRMAPNPDGTQFRLTYFTQFYASEAQADDYASRYAAASQATWAIQVPGWGFASADADKVYDITMDGCSCIFAGNNVNIHVHAKLESLYTLFSPPLSYPTNDHFYRVVIGHEFHHHLQYSINQWKLGNALTEGGARFSETIFEPEGAHGPNTITYLGNANGFSNWMLSPNVNPSSRTYDNGLFWGFLYSQDGGIAMLKRIYEESNNVAGGAEAIPNVVNAVLDEFAGPHDTFDQAYADFAMAMFTKRFVWGKADGSEPRDWGLYLPDVARVPFVSTGPGAGALVGAQVNYRGLHFAAPPVGDVVATGWASADPGASARWLWKTPGGAQAHAADPAFVLLGADVQDVALVTTRGPAAAQVPLPAAFQGRYSALAAAAL